ncbi:two-component system response regulator [Aeromonas dhakensis]|uniref:two-component system response regulator n=1 Tax=Aeromonas dhakensis TaxID=196024 RepID=UPI0007ED88FC|nr:EAL domain-containing protein [Aeromonas dhakensis]OBR45199.1 hypothetical protein A9196_02200 [Aeromonas dhakensis]UCM45184.1 EAL domain-containing protein [Aeromonas dhakensis]
MDLQVADLPRILIVDDQPINITILSEIVQELGQVVFALDGVDALEKADNLLPDLILLDIEMQGMSGFDVCQTLKQSPRTKEIPVIFISAHSEDKIEHRSLNYGAVDFISRPFSPEICRVRVRNHLLIRLQAKSILEKSRQLFAESQRLLVTLKSIGDAVIATDANGHVTFMNPIAEHLTGYRLADALNLPIEKVMILRDADSKQSSLNPVRVVLKEKRVAGMALNCELENQSTLQCYGVEDSAAPIFDENNELLGVIVVFHDVSEARAMALKMTYLANYDQLTGLPNRVLLHDRLHIACRQSKFNQSKVGVILLDIDRFKFVNDSIGHQAGDEILIQLANRVKLLLNTDSTMARFGGDEFIVVYPNVKHLDDVTRLALSIVDEISKPLVYKGNSYTLSASVGISVFPDDTQDKDELLRNADVAMFKAKAEGRNRLQFFSDELGDLLLLNHRNEQLLHEAIKQDQVEVFFQPIINLSDNSIQSMEALARIKQPNGQYLNPGQFIPLAEETGLIVPLGARVLGLACQQAALWLDKGLRIPVSVNIAAAQFNEVNFVASLNEILHLYRLPPAMLKLEVTETAVIQDPEKTAHILTKCRDIGIKVAIDDFGTGYSSLAYLKRFKVDIIKIDMSFVKEMLIDPSDQEIIKVIISLGNSMGARLIAEGVETIEQAYELRMLGCHMAQGYLYSKPKPAAELTEFILRSAKKNTESV